MVQGGKKPKNQESHVWIYTKMEWGDTSWIVKSSMHWSGFSVYLSDKVLTDMNTQVSGTYFRSSPQGMCNTLK